MTQPPIRPHGMKLDFQCVQTPSNRPFMSLSHGYVDTIPAPPIGLERSNS